jgi:3-deoxy-manno-octulosonate cytidylyltransferase (CMP-KDO synthetase)
MKIVGIIPARFGSTRFPGKPLQHLQNKPLLQWVVEVVGRCKSIDDFYVATDHDGIADLCKKMNVKYIMTSAQAATGTDRIFEACQLLKKNGTQFDVVINIQGDEPLLPVDYIDLLAKSFKDNAALEMATLSHPLMISDLENRNAVKVLIDQNKYAIYFSRFAIPFSRESASDLTHNTSVQKHIGLYGYSFDFLRRFCAQPQTFIEISESLEQLRALDMGARIKVLSVEKPTYGVDTPEDLENIEKLLNQKVSV